jgi:hypothetical protein
MKNFKQYITEATSKKIVWHTEKIKWEETTYRHGPDNKLRGKMIVSVPRRFSIIMVGTFGGGKRPSLYDRKDDREYIEDNMREAKLVAQEILEREYEWKMKKMNSTT